MSSTENPEYAFESFEAFLRSSPGCRNFAEVVALRELVQRHNSGELWLREAGQAGAGLALGGQPGLHVLGRTGQPGREVARAVAVTRTSSSIRMPTPRSSSGTRSSSVWKYRPGSTVST